LHEACGVFGVYAPDEDIARLTFFALFALQHRGQESAGIATSDGDKIQVYANMGLVSQVFSEASLTNLKATLVSAIIVIPPPAQARSATSSQSSSALVPRPSP